jgi:hypothetical protein
MVSDCKRGGTGCCNELQRMQGLSVRPASDLMPLNTQKIKQYAPLKSATARVGEGIEQLKSLPPAKRAATGRSARSNSYRAVVGLAQAPLTTEIWLCHRGVAEKFEGGPRRISEPFRLFLQPAGLQ